jgi:hypothetical protein
MRRPTTQDEVSRQKGLGNDSAVALSCFAASVLHTVLLNRFVDYTDEENKERKKSV